MRGQKWRTASSIPWHSTFRLFGIRTRKYVLRHFLFYKRKDFGGIHRESPRYVSQITDGQPRPNGCIYSCFVKVKNTLHVTPSNKSMWNGVSSHSIQLSQQDLNFINRERKLTPEDRRNNTDEYFLSKFKEDYDSWTEVTTDDIARLAKILGYDSVHISKVRDGNRTVADDWIMLNGGSAIKSATENNGDYSSNNDDIRFAIGRKRKEDMRRGLLNKLTNGKEKKKSTVQNRAGSPAKAGANATVISGDAASNLQTNLNNLAKKYNNKRTRTRGFITDLTQALGLEQHEASRYRNFELPDGRFVTFRLSNHNASAVTFDEHGEHEGISIVISSSRNNGIKNNGSAHVVEYFYGKKILDRAEGNPLAAIVKSVSEMFKTGEYVDTTGLAEVSEVNAPRFAIGENNAGTTDSFSAERGSVDVHAVAAELLLTSHLIALHPPGLAIWICCHFHSSSYSFAPFPALAYGS